MCLVAVGCAACAGEPAREFRSIDREVVRLAERDGRSAAAPFTPPEPIRVWSGTALDAWEMHRDPMAVRFVSPRFDDLPATVGPILLRVRPGGSREVRVTPHLGGLAVLHRVTVPLVGDGGTEEAVEVRVDLPKVIASAWETGLQLQQLEVVLPNADPKKTSLERIVFEHPAAEFSAGAGRGSLIVDGVIHPGWYVRGGSSVEFPVTMPTGKPALHQWAAAHGKAADWVIRVRDGDRTETLAGRAEPTGWRHQTTALDGLAGRSVLVELSCEADGICLFGDTEIVDVSPRPHATHVILYMIDTLRADRLGVFGNSAPDVSPVMDRLAREGVAFSFAFSTSSWTKPAIVALMTGVQPTTHRIGTRTYADQVPASVDLLQERFRSAGWRTGSFVSNPLGSTLSGLERGFGTAVTPRHWDSAPEARPKPSAKQLHDAVLAWIDDAPAEPSFTYVHTLDVHEWLEAGVDPYEAYDRAVQRQDRELGALLDGLATRGRLDRTLVIVVSDHGESLGEHGAMGHGNALLQSQIHIPLIFWAGPRLRPRNVPTPVGLADLPVTLLDLFGLPPLPEAQGRSLRAYVDGTGTPTDDERHEVPTELVRFVFRPIGPLQYSMITPERRKVLSSDGAFTRYDLQRDPGELTKIAEPWPEIETDLRTYLSGQERLAVAYERRHGVVVPGAIEGDQAGRLRALGYIE